MSLSQQFPTSILHTGPQPLQAVIEIARSNTSGPFNKIDQPIGVGAILQGPDGITEHRLSGYAASEDMAKAAMVQHLLPYIPDGWKMYAHVKGLTPLEYIPDARTRFGLKSNGERFKGYDVFEPIQWAETEFSWSQVRFQTGAEPDGYLVAKRLAKQALKVSLGLINKFDGHREEHPDWHMLEVKVSKADKNGPA